jgi:acyl-CoA dehydrogenase
MEFEFSDKVKNLQERVSSFMENHVYPIEHDYPKFFEQAENRWTTPPKMQELKAKAREQGLWNLFLAKNHGGELTNLEYAPLAEIMGRIWWAPEIFNCNAPDTGNMETLVLYGTEEQKERWLKPLMEGDIRSGFAMTEPLVASSDAANIECEIIRDGDEYVINGRKWLLPAACAITAIFIFSWGRLIPAMKIAINSSL